uniref:Uncharacterized protein n=1 Tax=uncultured marine virus TaxID=186617 RepID=A0A0F7L3V4_9VIRU|nr:hypothetical protein [uncultured marine virus]
MLLRCWRVLAHRTNINIREPRRATHRHLVPDLHILIIDPFAQRLNLPRCPNA